jgi:anti-anti-sigma factor
MDQLQIEQTPGSLPDVTILKLTGPVTLATLFDFQTLLRSPELKSTIIDFSAVPYMDSGGLGVLLSHWAHTQRHGSKFALVAMSDKVRVILSMTKVDTLLPQYPTAEDAEKAFSGTNSSSKASV